MDVKKEIQMLEELKKDWNNKYSELLEHVKGYEGYKSEDYYKMFQDNLNSISKELKELGAKYHEEVNRIADDIIDEHQGDPIIKSLMDGFKSNIDDNYNVYHGSREARLRDLLDIINMYDKYK